MVLSVLNIIGRIGAKAVAARAKKTSAANKRNQKARMIAKEGSPVKPYEAKDSKSSLFKGMKKNMVGPLPTAKKGGGMAIRGMGAALRGGGMALQGMGAAYKKGGMNKKK